MSNVAFLTALLYLVAINVAAFAAFGIDKAKARRDARRISEKTLMTLAIIGGSAGSLAGMRVFRHKTLKPKFKIGVPAVLIAHVALIAAFAYTQLSQTYEEPVFHPATVNYVVDGDTLDVSVDGTVERVRLIGIDAPESASHDEALNTAEGALATAYVRELLPAGTEVYLQSDEEDRDHYGRLLRYVWLAIPKNEANEDELPSCMLNARIVADGYARSYRYEPNTRYASAFEALEADAIDRNAGVSYTWGSQRS